MALLAFLLALAAQADDVREPTELCWGPPILFESGSLEIPADGSRYLDAFAAFRPDLERMPSIRFRIVGTTDSTGPAAANLLLSRRRAEAVRDYLVGRGFPAGLLEIDAQGERPDPPNPADREVARAVARSVMIFQEVARSEWRAVHGTVVC